MNVSLKHFLLWTIVLVFQATKIYTRFEFTNIKCISFDKDFSDFETCLLKSVNRSYKYMSLKVNLFKGPINKVTTSFVLLKRLNGYKPFLYNFSVDSCKFLARPSNLMYKYFYSLFVTYSNMNHSCPYDHDLIVEKLPTNFLNYRLTEVLPMPEGDYVIKSTWVSFDKYRSEVSVFFTIS